MIATKPRVYPQKLAGAAWLAKPETQHVLTALTNAGHDARLVGGTVRNALIGRAITDIDIATTATPNETIAAARTAGLKTFPTGIDHGTVTIVANHVSHEVTTLRRDVTTDGRRATVTFTKDWREDAQRRDFTINALFCDAGGTVHDYTGGMADLDARRVRFIGAAGSRIREDYLRILRFFRFSAEISDGRLDNDGVAACDAERAGLSQLSAERIRVEVLKLLAADAVLPVMAAMLHHGHLAALLGQAPSMLILQRLISIEQAIQQQPDCLQRLAALAVHVREDAARLGERLRLSRVETRALEQAAATPLQSTEVADLANAKTLLYRLGVDGFQRTTLHAWARSGAPSDDVNWHTWKALPDRWPIPVFPISGSDLLAEGMAPGIELGALLASLEHWWIERAFATGRPELLAEARRRLTITS